MGIDFVKKAAKPFHKGLDRDRVKLSTPDLFTQYPQSAPRVYAGRVHSGVSVAVDDQLVVRLEGGHVVACRGIDTILTLTNPPNEVLNALSASHGIACGAVKKYHPLSKVAEITLL